MLARKAEHVGIRGQALQLFKSYLKDRNAFVEIQGYFSKKRELGNKSVLQGTKMASFNYNLYTLEVGKLDEVIRNNELHKLLMSTENTEMEDDKEVDHGAVAYVNDLSQVMAHKNMLVLQGYILKMYELTNKFFKTNLLSVNETKTEILIIPPKTEEVPEAFIMTENGDVMKSQNQVKILGVISNLNNNMHSHLNSIASRIGLTYSKLKPYRTHASTSQRRIILQSKLESVSMYGA